jgi:hypothetical protein
VEKIDIGQNEFARLKALSNEAVSHVLKWLELSYVAQTLILSLRKPADIRSISRSFRKHLLQLQPVE